MIPSKFLSQPNFVLPVQTKHLENLYYVAALIDSSTTGNFIDGTLAKKLQLPPPAAATPPQCPDTGWRPHWGWFYHTVYQTYNLWHQRHAPVADFSPHHGHHQVPRGACIPIDAKPWPLDFLEARDHMLFSVLSEMSPSSVCLHSLNKHWKPQNPVPCRVLWIQGNL